MSSSRVSHSKTFGVYGYEDFQVDPEDPNRFQYHRQFKVDKEIRREWKNLWGFTAWNNSTDEGKVREAVEAALAESELSWDNVASSGEAFFGPKSHPFLVALNKTLLVGLFNRSYGFDQLKGRKSGDIKIRVCHWMIRNRPNSPSTSTSASSSLPSASSGIIVHEVLVLARPHSPDNFGFVDAANDGMEADSADNIHAEPTENFFMGDVESVVTSPIPGASSSTQATTSNATLPQFNTGLCKYFEIFEIF